jgi:16S rRNA (cytosine967-C5)-methyltransferase
LLNSRDRQSAARNHRARPAKTVSARDTALHILYAIDVEHAYSDVALRQVLAQSRLEQRDRAFVTECVYGVVRWQGRLDWLLRHACKRPLETLSPWIRAALRLGLYQCLWMDRVPQWAAVHETVALARRYGHQGTAGLVNGVLRTVLRQHRSYVLPDAATHPVQHLAVAFSFPEWLVERWLQRYGWVRTRALCMANNRVAGVTLRTNTLRTTPAALAERLRQEGLRRVEPSGLIPEGLEIRGTARLDHLPSYDAGLFQVQDVGAMLVAPLCRVRPGLRVLDACAAPGGKTTHLAQLMRDTGRILACDVHVGRLHMLQSNLGRLGLTSVDLIATDASQPVPARGGFDRILIDAPCSGLGAVRRHPDIKWRKSPVDVPALAALQLRLLQSQYRLLAPHGLLVYSVCSHEPEETHEVVARFLATHPELHLDAVEADLPVRPKVPSPTPGTLELTPEQWQTEGVFVARFRRRQAHAAEDGAYRA